MHDKKTYKRLTFLFHQKFDVQNPASVNVPSARYIRLYPESWQDSICMRVRLYKKEGGNYVGRSIDLLNSLWYLTNTSSNIINGYRE